MSMVMEVKELLLGDEAIARAALDAGISGAYAYPGTPSTEILEYIQQARDAAERNVHRRWSANEKTAMEEALGMSYAGRRALVSMKHVGLNVASDAFVNSAITGVNGGLVIVVADDPSMHSSQNEQDSRFYAKFAFVPLLEPATQQQAHDMTRQAFDLSERLRLPVVLRVTTRLAHSRAEIDRAPVRPPNPLSFPTDNRQFILLPANARRNYAQLLEKQTEINQLSEQSAYNRIRPGVDKSLGIVAAGVGINYLAEATAETGLDHPVLELGQYPLPRKMLGELAAHCSRILVIEEGAPFIEEALVGVLSGGIEVIGRLTGLLPRTGELSPDFVAKALGRDVPAVYTIPECVAPRPPGMCKGCPHSDSYNFITEALAGIDGARVFSDIGCYTLGALPPYNAIHSCVDMGASITMAKGAADAGVRPSIAVIGDSTFMHSGLTGLLDAIVEKTPLTLIILDNDAVAMTGAQESHGTGRIERIVLGLGVDREHVRVVTPLRKGHAENVAVLQEELAYEGVSVIISERECIQAIRKDP